MAEPAGLSVGADATAFDGFVAGLVAVLVLGVVGVVGGGVEPERDRVVDDGLLHRVQVAGAKVLHPNSGFKALKIRAEC